MGQVNNAMLKYLQDNERFADLFNACCFDGKEIIEAKDLVEGSEVYIEDPKEFVISEDSLSHKAKRKMKTKQRIRDLKKNHLSGMVLRVLALENQNHVDYTISWRIMGYDYHEYGKQIEQIKQRNQKEAKLRTRAERLCGLCKEDRLIPVYTVCLYHGEELWDGPRSLKDMVDIGEGEVIWEKMFSDYKIHLVCLNEIQDFSCFHSPLRELFELLPYRKDKNALQAVLDSNPIYQSLDYDTAVIASVLLGVSNFEVKKEKYQKEGKYNMCTAIRELMEDSRKEGIDQGISQGISQGKTLGMEDKAKLVASNLYKRGYSVEDIAVITEESIETVGKWYREFAKKV